MAKQLNRPQRVRRRWRPSLMRHRLLLRRRDRQIRKRLLERPLPKAIVSRTHRNPNPAYTFVPRYSLPDHLSADELIERGRSVI